MTSLLRLAGCASILGLFCVGAYAFFPAVWEDAGLDFSEWIRCQRIFNMESQRGEELSRQRVYAVERLVAKDAIARAVIAGRLSVAEAVKRFDEMPFPPPKMRELIHLQYGGATAEESMVRHVVEWACQLPEREPDRAALRSRLEGELRASQPDARDRP